MSVWGLHDIELAATEIEVLRQLAEAWLARPEGERIYFHIGFEMACGDQDGTFITHPDLPNQMLRVNLIVVNKLAHKGIIEIAGPPGEQCFSLSETGEAAHRQLIGRHQIDPFGDRGSRSLSPSEPFGSLLILYGHLRTAQTFLYWFEPHLPGKVLEVIYHELERIPNKISIRLLSGENTLKASVQTDFRRFQKELSEKGYPQPVWRVMTDAKAREIHGRFLFTDSGQWHIPPLNTILMGTVDEIHPSEKTRSDFEAWWVGARDLLSGRQSTSGGGV